MNTTALRTQAQIAPITLLVVALAVINWVLVPARALHWGIGIGTMLAVWLIVTFLGHLAEIRDHESERRMLALSALAAGVMLAASLALALYRNLEPMARGGALLERAPNVLIGVVLALMGNMVPKVIKPLAARTCSSIESQSLRRFTGWSFALAGLGYTIAWLALPIRLAERVSMTVCAAALVLVVIRIARSSLLSRSGKA